MFVSTGYLPILPTTVHPHPYHCLPPFTPESVTTPCVTYYYYVYFLYIIGPPTHTFTDTLPFVVSGLQLQIRCIQMGRSARLHCHYFGLRHGLCYAIMIHRMGLSFARPRYMLPYCIPSHIRVLNGIPTSFASRSATSYDTPHLNVGGASSLSAGDVRSRRRMEASSIT